MSTPATALLAEVRKPAILIVDDAAEHLGVLRSILLQQGYQTFVATSGERALEIAQRIQPDLIQFEETVTISPSTPTLDGVRHKV